MQCNKVSAVRVAVALALSFCVNVVSYAGNDPAKLIAALVRLRGNSPEKEMVLASHNPIKTNSSTKGGSSGSSSSSTSK